jgi:HEAT repeat protein
LELGAPGIEALASLLQDEHALVRVTAAYYLLPFKTEESLKILEAAAKGKGVSALSAFIILARWKGGERGVWDALASDIPNRQ